MLSFYKLWREKSCTVRLSSWYYKVLSLRPSGDMYEWDKILQLLFYGKKVTPHGSVVLSLSETLLLPIYAICQIQNFLIIAIILISAVVLLCFVVIFPPDLSSKWENWKYKWSVLDIASRRGIFRPLFNLVLLSAYKVYWCGPQNLGLMKFEAIGHVINLLNCVLFTILYLWPRFRKKRKILDHMIAWFMFITSLKILLRRTKW